MGRHENAVVLYDRNGKSVRAYELDQLVPKEDRDKFIHSVSSRWWNNKAKYYFLKEPARFYIVLPWDRVLEFFLEGGKFRYSRLADFSDLSSLTKTSSPNEETEIWATSLRFSSMTDVLRASGKLK